jgi:hypothetical protein
MTRFVNGIAVVEEELPQQCDDCGKIAELRPLGPNNTVICYECGKKDPEGTYLRYAKWWADNTMPAEHREDYMRYVAQRLAEDPDIAVMP